MTDTIVLLEEQKEITTFLLDDGVKTLVDNVITPIGSNLGFEYSDKCMVDDVLCISDKSSIGHESLPFEYNSRHHLRKTFHLEVWMVSIGKILLKIM